jgi:hypothetical protein
LAFRYVLDALNCSVQREAPETALEAETVGCHLAREKETKKAFSKPDLSEARNDEGNFNAVS